ncbi:BREX-1 system adenine-specific DNA-methyltransferase PglX [bacterium M00.F.Ca.ET.152.01.1.1]|nr:BREX-1 system adenine-specific DNA-methyltransferase PglX [bacterium M00.F.Ca.ET.152.01.1.1]
MDTGALKKFAQEARRVLRDQVSTKLAQVLVENSAARREAPKAVQQLQGEIGHTSREQVIERVAYTWFNRFTALRFMDANGYTAVRVVTPADGQTRPEILSEAMAGVIGNEVPQAVAAQVRALLDNRTPSRDAQGEAYRLLLVATCNHWHAAMPFMFETIADYTELLMPEDLLSQGSIRAKLRTVMTEDACQDVEIIGWLYQFYISEKKDEVFAGLKKNKKITPENIPAATQLFTPHWVVRYLVENSLGRLWMLNRPKSRLNERMDYYIAPEEREKDFLRIFSPEEIKVCDPACGSGHMLTYAFDLLHAIYEEEGYDAAEIPRLILTHNLHGIELDERAGALAAFALTMKAAARRKRFLRGGVQPNICVLHNVSVTEAELRDYEAEVGRDLFTEELRETLGQFDQAKNFGSLIVPKLNDPAEVAGAIAAKSFEDNLFLRETHERVLSVLRMVDFLLPKYHVVVANPPYMNSSGMNEELKKWGKETFPTCWGKGRSDTFAMFIERGFALLDSAGSLAMVTMESWMFLGTFRALRSKLLGEATIFSMVHMPYLGKGGTSMGINFGTSAFVCQKGRKPDAKGLFVCVRYYETDELGVPFEFPVKNERLSYACARDFEKIPSTPISYWLSDRAKSCFEKFSAFSEKAVACQGLATTDNNRFVRDWSEASYRKIGFHYRDSAEALTSGNKWFPMDKGGDYRRWYGNNFAIVNWANDGKEIRDNIVRKYPYLNGNPDFVAKNPSKYFLPGVTWGKITSGVFSARFTSEGSIFSDAGMKAFPIVGKDPLPILALLNSKIAPFFLSAFSETMNFEQGDIARIPFAETSIEHLKTIVNLSKCDWDAYETSWDFSLLPLLAPEHRQTTLAETYAHLRAHWLETTEEMQRLEEENNRIFIDAYGLQDELTPEVPLEEITLTCNPAYRYGGKRSEAALEALLLSDTMREFVSYAVGCMFGRYSLDAPGLILANQGEGLEDYLAKVPSPSYEPDADNVSPVLDGDWFADDIAARFRKFLRVTFGDEHFQESLTFIEEALGKDIRKYFTRDFFNDHVKRYKRRPIYWLFSSPRGTFNALIYMHRYRPETVSVMLNDYLREFRSKLEAHRRAQEALSISGEASPAQKNKALKEIEATAKQIEELDAWERDVLFPLATQKIEIDLDDGVKINYPKFGAALKPIKGLNDAED